MLIKTDRTLYFLFVLMQNCFDTINNICQIYSELRKLRHSVDYQCSFARFTWPIVPVMKLTPHWFGWYRAILPKGEHALVSYTGSEKDLEFRIDPPNFLTSFDWRLLDGAWNRFLSLIGTLLGMQSAPTGLRSDGARKVTCRRYLSTR